MNAKHPIDELFAQSLRDAEATPPSVAWQGIVLERHRRRRATMRQRRRTAFLLLVLLIGSVAGSLLVHKRHSAEVAGAEPAHREGASPAGVEISTMPDDRKNEIASIPGTPAPPSRISAENNTAGGFPEVVGAAPAHRHDGQKNEGAPATLDEHRSDGPLPPAYQHLRDRSTGQRTTGDRSSPASLASADDAMGGQVPMQVEEPGYVDIRTAVSGNGSVLPMDILRSPLERAQAEPAIPGSGATIQPYVLRKGTTWVGVQLEMTNLSCRWTGPFAEAAALNTSESWSDRKGLGIAVGRDRQGGLGMELAASYSHIRSNLFFSERGPNIVQSTTDTTWTSTPMGQQTIYTWNIITMDIAEPGPVNTYSATNSYDRLRIDGLLSYRKAFGRWSAALRAGPSLILFLDRKGNSLKSTGPASEPSSVTLVPLEDASLDDRFAPRAGVLAGLDVRYRFTEHVFLGAGPTFLTTLGGEQAQHIGLSTQEWGATLRLAYEFPQHERPAR